MKRTRYSVRKFVLAKKSSSTLIAGIDCVIFTSALSDGSGISGIHYSGNGGAEGEPVYASLYTTVRAIDPSHMIIVEGTLVC